MTPEPVLKGCVLSSARAVASPRIAPRTIRGREFAQPSPAACPCGVAARDDPTRAKGSNSRLRLRSPAPRPSRGARSRRAARISLGSVCLLRDILCERQRVALRHRWWFKFLDQTKNDFLGNGMRSVFVLCQDGVDGRLKIDDFNSRSVISEEINPALAHLMCDVRRIEGELSACSKMLATLLTRSLDNFTLIVRCLNIERVAD